MTAPRATSRVDRQPARSGRVFVLNRHGCTRRARAGHVSSKSDKVRVRDDSIVDIDREVIRLVACASLCHENKVPGPVKRRPCLRRGSDRDETACDHQRNKRFHHVHAPCIILKASPLGPVKLSRVPGRLGCATGDQSRRCYFRPASAHRNWCARNSARRPNRKDAWLPTRE
jgi:hypothetical protein